MKKFVSLFMAVCMLSMCFGTATMVFAGGTATDAWEQTFTADFEDGVVPTSGIIYPANSSFASIETVEGRGEVLKLSQPASTHQIWMDASSMVGANRKLGRLTYDFDMRMENDAIAVKDKDNGFVLMSVASNYIRSGASTTNLTDFENASWNNVKMVIDFSRNTVEYYLNGNFAGQYSTSDIANFNNEKVFKIQFRMPSSCTGLYFDNVVVDYTETKKATDVWEQTFAADFEDRVVPTSGIIYPANSSFASIETVEGRGEVLKLSQPASTHQIWMDASSMVGANRKLGRLTYDFDMRMENDAIAVKDKDNGFVLMSVASNYIRSGASTTNLADFENASWNNVKMVIDFSEDTVKYYLNEKAIGQFNTSDIANFNNEKVFKIQFRMATSCTGLYFDNVTINYTEMEEEISNDKWLTEDFEGSTYDLVSSLVPECATTVTVPERTGSVLKVTPHTGTLEVLMGAEELGSSALETGYLTYQFDTSIETSAIAVKGKNNTGHYFSIMPGAFSDGTKQSDNKFTQIATFNAGSWNTARLVFDLGGQKLSYIINGELKSERLFSEIPDFNKENIFELQFRMPTDCTGFYLDNVNIGYTETVPSMITEITVGEKAVEGIAEGVNEYSVSVFNNVYKNLKAEDVLVTLADEYKDSATVKVAISESDNNKYATITVINGEFVNTCIVECSGDNSLAALGETFTSTKINGAAINPWMSIKQPDNTTVTIEDGRLKVSVKDTNTWWENTLVMNLISDKTFADIYKSIRKDNTFTAGTTKLGTLSYEFDMNIPESGTTVVLFNTANSGTRHFRINAGASSANGFHAGTSEKLADFAANRTYKIKVAYSFENQNVSYYLDGSLAGTTNFTDTIYNAGKKIDDNDMFGMSLGVAKNTTVYFDNFVVKYEAEDYIMQDFAATKEDGSYKVSGAVVNPFDKVNGAVVMFAAYKNDALVYVDLVDATTQAFEQTVVDETFSVPAGTDYDNVKVFAWRDFASCTPLVPAIPLQ